MNCSVVQRRLRALDEPAAPPDTIQEHLDNCPHCLEVYRRLMQIERLVPHLPVPRSAAKAPFLQRFHDESTTLEKVRFRIRNLQRWQLTAGAIAASLLLFFLAWSLAPNDPSPVAKPPKSSTPDRLLAQLIQRNLKLAATDSPKLQLETLAELSEDLRVQSEPLHTFYGTSRDGKESLRDLADWYGKVVRLEVTRAVHLRQQLTPEQLRPVLQPIVVQLSHATDDAERLASETINISADHPLHTIASAARTGKDHLEKLLKDEAVVVPPRRPRFPVSLAQEQRAALRQLSLVPLACLAVAPARAQSPSPVEIAADQAQRFQRNRELIHALVENCLKLAGQLQTVDRASSCTDVADKLAEEMQRAIADRDVGRASDLGKAFKDLLVHGVAFNLTTAGGEIPVGGLREAELLQVGEHVQRIVAPLELQLARIPAKDNTDRWQRVLKQVTDGQAEVLKALKGRGTY
jgi:hypothetical protein